VRDIAQGILLAAERGRSGERYILGGENVPLSELLTRLERLSGRRMPRRRIPPSLALAAGAVSERVARLLGTTPMVSLEGVRIALRSAPFDTTKAARELGYAPRPIAEALADAVRWLSEQDKEKGRPVRGPQNASFSTK
jgi:dihydroflavonol-4-reductase